MSQAENRNTTIPSRRTVLAGAPAVAAAALAGGTAVNALAIAEAKAEVDPIFAAIQSERKAFAVYRATAEVAEDVVTEHVHTEACKAWWASQETLMTTQPTSLAGLHALLDHVGDHCDPDKGWIDEWAELGFPTLAAAVRSLTDGRLA
jgi:hypothetical protein